jgi:hypothetical protein
MSVLALTWPAAVVISTAIAAGGLVLAVSAWQIFKTGQTAIEHENRRASAGEPVAER